MQKISRIIILGHSGFIGKSLEAFLSREHNAEIIGKSLPEVDLSNEESAALLKQYLNSETGIILAAAAKRQFGDTLEALRHNTSIVENVCKLIQEKPVARLVYFSSAAVYGEETHNRNISETTSVNPTSFYGINKYTSERILKKVCIENNISLVSLRPPLIYGPGDRAFTYGPSGFSKAALKNEAITLWGDGSELREFIYINDICRIVHFMVNSDYQGEINTVSGNQYCFADIINILRTKYPGLEVNSRERSKDKADNAFDPELIKSILPSDFKFTALETGLENTLAELEDVL